MGRERKRWVLHLIVSIQRTYQGFYERDFGSCQLVIAEEKPAKNNNRFREDGLFRDDLPYVVWFYKHRRRSWTVPDPPYYQKIYYVLSQ